MNIYVEDLSFKFGDKQILNRISLKFEEGKVYSILGKNGTGKTTLLKNILGILSPCSGKVKIGEHEVRDMPEKELSKMISYVPQILGYDLNFDVETVVLLGRNPHINSFSRPKSSDYRLAKQAIESVNMEKYSKESFSSLSGGQKQLVLIARALAQDTRFIILDEPTASLDIKNQHEVMKLIKRISIKYNKGIIISIHDPELSYRYCDGGVMIKDGEVIAAGDMKSIFTDHSLTKLYELKFEIIERVDGGKLLYVL